MVLCSSIALFPRRQSTVEQYASSTTSLAFSPVMHDVQNAESMVSEASLSTPIIFCPPFTLTFPSIMA